MNGVTISQKPTVSVIVPAYNVAPYIAATVESVLAQTYRDFELIVVNDGSTDETEAQLAAFRDDVIYLTQANGGVMRARNAGLARARGRYLALLDGDDIWEPDFLSTLVGLLETDPQFTAVFPNARFLASPKFPDRLYQDVYPASEPVSFDRVLRRECYIFCSLVMRRSALELVGDFDESLPGQGAEDFDLWLRMLRAGCRFGFMRAPLVQYRWRPGSLSNTGVGLLRCLLAVYEKMLAGELTAAQRAWVITYLPELRAALDYALFKQAALERRYKTAAQHLAAANRFYRRPKLAAARVALQLAPAWVTRLLNAQ